MKKSLLVLLVIGTILAGCSLLPAVYRAENDNWSVEVQLYDSGRHRDVRYTIRFKNREALPIDRIDYQFTGDILSGGGSLTPLNKPEIRGKSNKSSDVSLKGAEMSVTITWGDRQDVLPLK